MKNVMIMPAVAKGQKFIKAVCRSPLVLRGTRELTVAYYAIVNSRVPPQSANVLLQTAFRNFCPFGIPLLYESGTGMNSEELMP